MYYLPHYPFYVWKMIMALQDAEIEAIPMVCFTPFGKVFDVDIPLRHQVSITTQYLLKFSRALERLKCYRERLMQIILFEDRESDTICRNSIRYLEVRCRHFRVKRKAAKVDE